MIVELDDCEVKIREGRAEVRPKCTCNVLVVIDFDDYRPNDRGTWAVFREGEEHPRLVARVRGRYDAVKRWVARNEKDATKILLEPDSLVVSDDYGLRKEIEIKKGKTSPLGT